MMAKVIANISRYLIITTLLLTNSGLRGAGIQSNTITLYTEINHPYVYHQEGSKKLTGIAYEIVTEMMKRTNLKAEIVVAPWLRTLRMHEQNDNSCVFVMNRTEKREKQYQWVGLIITGGLAIFKRPDSSIDINSLNDLKPYLLVGKTDSQSIYGLSDQYGIDIIEVDSDEKAIELLYHGRVELMAGGIIDAPLAAKYLGLPKPEIALKRGVALLSMGCSLNLDDLKMKKLINIHNSMTNYRNKILNKYLLII